MCGARDDAASYQPAPRLSGHGGGLGRVSAAGGGGEEPVAASPGPAAAAEVTVRRGVVMCAPGPGPGVRGPRELCGCGGARGAWPQSAE